MNTKKKNIIKMVGILILGLLLGWLIFGGSSSKESNGVNATELNQNTVWTCSMHPQIRQNEPGNCPICGMELIPLDEDNIDTEQDPMSISMSQTAMQIANVGTQIVSKAKPVKSIRLNGKVEAVYLDGERFDCGSQHGFIKAILKEYEQRKNIS